MSSPVSFIKRNGSRLFNRYTVFLVGLLLWTEIMQHFGGLPSLRTAWRLEIPLLLYLYWLANRMVRPSRWQPWVAALPFIVLYGIFDCYHIQFGRLLRITEISQLPELFQVIPLSMKCEIGLLVGLPIMIFLGFLRIRRLSSVLASGMPLLILIFAAMVYPDQVTAIFAKIQPPMVFYSDAQSARSNGRLVMMFYNEAKRRSSLAKTVKYRDNSAYFKKFTRLTELIRAQHGKRNVHLVVLESFLDPSLLSAAKFSRNPVHPDFAALMNGKGSLTQSPVFGGGTAQAEFEVLCGVPAMQELTNIEFNMFTGSKTLCLPEILSEGGYQTMAGNAFYPDFFNSTNAYEGMGFKGIFYPIEYAPGRESYLSVGDVTGEKFMFDGDLMSQNLAYVARRIKQSPKTPIFNYLISMYGHMPHAINTDKRPELIKLENDFYDDQLERAVNQYYYRTQAIAAYVQGLMQIDPHSLIILVSDHLPPLTHGPDSYREFNYLAGVENDIYLNRVYFIENGKVVHYRTIHHYDIPQIVLNYITHGQSCRDGQCRFTADATDDTQTARRQEYLTIMARAML